MTHWTLEYSKQARRDAKKLRKSGLRTDVETLLEILSTDPYTEDPPYKELGQNLAGILSRRITHQHRLTYRVNDKERTVKVLTMWTHYHQ